MSRHFGILISLIVVNLYTFGQKTEKLYDVNLNECVPEKARIYSTVEKKKSEWERNDYYLNLKKTLKYTGHYKDSTTQIAEGIFHAYYPSTYLESVGRYENNQKEGLWITYHFNKIMSDSSYYHKGIPYSHYSWYSNGFIQDSFDIKEDGSGVGVSWFDNGVPASAGKFGIGEKKVGKWQYYYSNGVLSATEIYNAGDLVDKQYFDQNGKVMGDTTCKDRNAEFPGGTKAWLRYLSKSLYWPIGYKINHSDGVSIKISFTINEEGKAEDIFTVIPFDATFSDIAEYAVKKSPKWIPALQHNRKVKSKFFQIVTFNQDQ